MHQYFVGFDLLRMNGFSLDSWNGNRFDTCIFPRGNYPNIAAGKLQTMKFVLLSLILIFTVGCISSNEQKDETESVTQEPKQPSQVDITNYETESGRIFTVVEKQLSNSLSRFSVQGTGFPNSQEIFTIVDSDPIEKGFLEDLDGNGFEELYLVTRAAGSGAYASIYAFASFNDKSYGQIYIPEIAEDDPVHEGYMGHDRISAIGDRLVREFPVYKDGDTNAKPTGGFRMIRYALVAGEASYVLKLESVSNR